MRSCIGDHKHVRGAECALSETASGNDHLRGTRNRRHIRLKTFGRVALQNQAIFRRPWVTDAWSPGGGELDSCLGADDEAVVHVEHQEDGLALAAAREEAQVSRRSLEANRLQIVAKTVSYQTRGDWRRP